MDLIISEKLNSFLGQSFYFDLIIVFLAKYFPYILLLMFLFLLIFLMLQKDREKIYLNLWVGLTSATISRYGFTELIRLFYSRPRPFEIMPITQLVEHSQGGSFPSGHMAFFFALSAGVYSWNKKTGIWFFTASSLIGLARIFAGLHWPSDILGGAVLGFLVFLLFKKLSKIGN